MLAVFRKALLEAENHGRKLVWGLVWRELRDLPGALVRTHLEFIMAEQKAEEPSPWGEVALGALWFLVSGLYLIWDELPLNWFGGLFSYPETGILAFFWKALWVILVFLPYIGLCIGYIKGFPRWSYPYVGAALIWSLFMIQAATPDLRLFGYEILGRQVWGLRAFVPPSMALLVAILVTRSLQPFRTLVTNAWKDWTKATYAMFGFTPLLILAAFDEMDRLYSLYFMVLLTVVMLATAILYLRATLGWQRAVTLFVGVGIVIGTATAAPIFYWQKSGQVEVGMQILLGMIVLLVFYWPPLLGLVQYLEREQQVGDN